MWRSNFFSDGLEWLVTECGAWQHRLAMTSGHACAVESVRLSTLLKTAA